MLTTREAQDVNTLLRWLLDDGPTAASPVASDEARAAATRLATRAAARLHVGVTAVSVAAGWPATTNTTTAPTGTAAAAATSGLARDCAPPADQEHDRGRGQYTLADQTTEARGIAGAAAVWRALATNPAATPKVIGERVRAAVAAQDSAVAAVAAPVPLPATGARVV